MFAMAASQSIREVIFWAFEKRARTGLDGLIEFTTLAKKQKKTCLHLGAI